MKKVFIFLMITLVSTSVSHAQYLKPGFNISEYIESLKISARCILDSNYHDQFSDPEYFKKVYRSPIIGLDNLWELWVDQQNSVAAISIRGTTANSVSWLSNFYAAMVPAKGELQISNTEKFKYELASSPQAAVHVGWLVSTALLSQDIIPKIDSCYNTGIKDVFIIGHSQGGAIAYLLTAHLYSLQKQGTLPTDLRLKTYCSAGPKPGNLYFAYEYEAATQQGWAYNVVNSADWVPEVPISIQTLNDFNVTNPFVNAKVLIKKQKFPNNLALKYIYNQLNNPTMTAQKNYQKYLGEMASKAVAKNILGYVPPQYYNSSNYVRTGASFVLLADEDYYKIYPDDKDHVFVHHFHSPYLYMAEKMAGVKSSQKIFPVESKLNGTWELSDISTAVISKQYTNQKPTITFDVGNMKITGNTSCNNFNGKLIVGGKNINFKETLAMTKMMCEGIGEKLFLEALESVETYTVSNDKLALLKGDETIMTFVKKQ